MAAELETFSVSRSSWQEDGTLLNINVGFAVYGLETSGVAPAQLMVNARAMLPAFGTNFDSPDARASTAKLVGVTFSGNSVDAVYGVMSYSTATGLEPTTLVITTDTRTVSVLTNMGPDGTLIKARYTVPESDIGVKIIVPTDFIEQQVRVPCTQITIDSLNYGAPDLSREQYVGRVIGETYRTRDSGSWLVDGFTTVYSVYRGVTSSRLVILGAPGGKKWWLTGILENKQIGKKVYYAGMEADVKAAIATDYGYGEKAPDGKGFSVFGWYDTVSLANLSLPPAAL